VRPEDTFDSWKKDGKTTAKEESTAKQEPSTDFAPGESAWEKFKWFCSNVIMPILLKKVF
jgi:hypothetical protein